MNLRLVRLYFTGVFILFFTGLSAQMPSEDEYKAEIGINGGTGYYLGEANSELFNNMQYAFSGFFRYRFNNRLSLKAELTNTPVMVSKTVSNPIYCGDICGEFNFFDLERNPYKRYSKTVSPYIFGGISTLTDVYDGQKLPETGLLFGVGVKIKLKKRWNLNAQWGNRLMFADNLEGTTQPDISDNYNNPNGLNGTNILNNDLLSTFTIGFSYDIWKKHCKCMGTNNYRPNKKYKK